MTSEQAIEILKYYKPKENEIMLERDANPHKDGQAFKLAIEALKSRTKKPLNVRNRRNFKGEVYMQVGECPTCGYDLDSAYQFCKLCGNCLDWSVGE